MPFKLWFIPYEYALDSNKRRDARPNDPLSDLTTPANCLYPNRVRRGVYVKLTDVYSGEFGIGEIPVPFYGPSSGGDGDRELQGELVKALDSSREKFTLSPELLLDELLLDEVQIGLGQGLISAIKLHIDGWVDAVCVSILSSCNPPAFLQVGIRCALIEGITCAVLVWLSKKKASDLSLRLLYKWFYGETETAESLRLQKRGEPAMAGSFGASNCRDTPMRIGVNRLVIPSCSESVSAVTPDAVRDGLRVKVKVRTVDEAVDVLRTLQKRSSYSNPESGNNVTGPVCESNKDFLFCESSHWVRLDVDASFSLSELEAACTKAGQLELLDLIEYVEDPILDSFFGEVPHGSRSTRVQVALDVGRRTEQFSEIVKGSHTVQGNAGQYLGQLELPFDVLVVKPHLYPISEAVRVGKGGYLIDVLTDPISQPVGSPSIVVSCTWESGIGLGHLALIASAVSAPAAVHGVYAFPGRRYSAKRDGSYSACEMSFCESVIARFVESCQMSSVDKACSIDLIQCEKLLLETDVDE